MAETIRGGKRYNEATGRYLGPVVVGESGPETVAAPTSDYQSMTKAQISELLDEAEIEYPSRASHPLLVQIAETEIG